jgi:hypothetical protein
MPAAGAGGVYGAGAAAGAGATGAGGAYAAAGGAYAGVAPWPEAGLPLYGGAGAGGPLGAT